MKERPILFSAPMVRAILEGRKTMTRRVVKPQPVSVYGSIAKVVPYANTVDFIAQFSNGDPAGAPMVGPCPYGPPGDRIWVRETFRETGSAQQVDGKLRAGRDQIVYKAEDDTDHGPWRPSIFMPRWASRILLEVTAVRVERMQDISEEDAEAEGVGESDPGGMLGYREHFSLLWGSINAKRGYGWDFNPWVWVVEFKRIEPV